MLELLLACTPGVHPITAAAIVQQESAGNPWALYDNTGKQSYRPKSQREAAEIALRLIGQGHSVDIGLAQINSKNLPRLNLTVEQVLDPCTNLQASSRILKEGYERAGNLPGALSAYNTGKTDSSIGEKYAAKVFSHAGSDYLVPAIPGGKMADWVKNGASLPGAGLPPAHAIIVIPPEASSLAPAATGLSPGGFK